MPLSRNHSQNAGPTIAIAAIGFALLFFNTQMPRRTFRNVVSQTAFEYEYADINSHGESNGYDNERSNGLPYRHDNQHDYDSGGNRTSNSFSTNTSSANRVVSISSSRPENNDAIVDTTTSNSTNRRSSPVKNDNATSTTTKNRRGEFLSTIVNTSSLEIHDSIGNSTYLSEPPSRNDANGSSTDLKFTVDNKDSKRIPIKNGYAATEHTSASKTKNELASQLKNTTIESNFATTSSSTTTTTSAIINWTTWRNATEMEDGNIQIEFFRPRSNSTETNASIASRQGMAACLINLEDTIRLAEWIPYHFATLPLTGLVIALDPKTSQRGARRTLELINLWRDKIEITLWPDYKFAESKRFRTGQSYVRERQVYFANRCLSYHKIQNRSWTLLTDNDEYLVFNYIHDDEIIKYDHPGSKKGKVKKVIDKNRKRYMPLRSSLPPQNQSTVHAFLEQLQRDYDYNTTLNDTKKKKKGKDFLPRCVRFPGIHYGGNRGLLRDHQSPAAFNSKNVGDATIIDPSLLSTYRDVHHDKRKSKFSKVMIDVSRVSLETFEWTPKNARNAKTIHNPSRVCGYNGSHDSGADYYSSLFRLNHYLGSLESFMERSADYRKKRTNEGYAKKAAKVNTTEHGDWWDRDVGLWVDLLVQRLGGGAVEAKRLLAPIAKYTNATMALGTNHSYHTV